MLCFPAVHGSSAADNFVFDADVGGRLGTQPTWLGSTRYEFSALPAYNLNELVIPGLVTIRGTDLGFSLAPSFNYISSRSADSEPRLQGLGHVSDAYEFGVKASYTWPFLRLLGVVRYGFGGYNGVVGRLGADAIWHITPRTKFEIGPRVSFGGSEFMRKYFTVTEEMSAASGYEVHHASSGLYGAGVAATLRHQLDDRWAILSKFDYNRLVDDAADAPFISHDGRNQFEFGIGLTYRLRVERPAH
ncbi:MAG: MipA/OmpV family protein, partial [Hyphomicrobiaceae bacterium]